MPTQRITVSLVSVRAVLTDPSQVEAIAQDLAVGQDMTDEYVALAIAELGRRHSKDVPFCVANRPSRYVIISRPLPTGTFKEAAR